MISRKFFAQGTAALALAASIFAALPGATQSVPPADLPLPDAGAVGELLDPVTDIVDDTLALVDGLLGDTPLSNSIRLNGTDAVSAAVALSQATFTTSDLVLIARDDVFADTLSSVAAQGIAGAPLLLTQTNGIDDRTMREIERLGATRVMLLGSENAIATTVELELVARGFQVNRAGGESRIETAVEIARQLAPSANTAILIRAYADEGADEAQAYADALAVGPFGSMNDFPVLLTTSDSLHPATETYLAESNIDHIYVIGGEAAISGAIEQVVGGIVPGVTRLAGSNRYATAIAVASELGYTTSADTSRVILAEASGSDAPLWAAGFAAASHGAVYEAPVILSAGPILPPETITFLSTGLVDNALRLNNLPVLCNSFVDTLACESASLLAAGQLGLVDELTDGAVGAALGPVFDDIVALLDDALPGDDGLAPALIDAINAVLDLPEGEREALAYQPVVIQDAANAILGTQGNRPTPSRQALLIAQLRAVDALIGDAALNTNDPAQAEALAGILRGTDNLLGGIGQQPLAETADLLNGVEGLVRSLLGNVELGSVTPLVGGLAADAPSAQVNLLADVADLLANGGDTQRLMDTYGAEAEGVAAAVRALQAG